jgi:hypothetical protein
VAADVDYISTVGANVTTEFWSFAGRAPDNKENEPFLAFMQANAYTTTSYRTLAFRTAHGLLDLPQPRHSARTASLAMRLRGCASLSDVMFVLTLHAACRWLSAALLALVCLCSLSSWAALQTPTCRT